MILLPGEFAMQRFGSVVVCQGVIHGNTSGKLGGLAAFPGSTGGIVIFLCTGNGLTTGQQEKGKEQEQVVDRRYWRSFLHAGAKFLDSHTDEVDSIQDSAIHYCFGSAA